MPSEPVTGSKRGLVELFDRDQFILLLGVLWFFLRSEGRILDNWSSRGSRTKKADHKAGGLVGSDKAAQAVGDGAVALEHFLAVGLTREGRGRVR